MNTFMRRMRLADLELLELNARYMRHETFATLVENVKRDGALTSVPFAHLRPDGRYRVLSGNHRTKAALEAGIEEADVMLTDDVLSEQECIAIQLSHNALTGEDDPTTLARLYELISDIDLRKYSGLDDKTLELMAEVSVASLSEANLSFQSIQVVFLPHELEEARKTWESAKAMLKGTSGAWLNRWAEYDGFLDTLQTVRESYGVNNTATALMVLLRLFERHAQELSAGWEKEPEGRDRWVPLQTIIGTTRVPVSAAKVIRKAVEKMVNRGDVSRDAQWQVLEFLCAEYLAGLDVPQAATPTEIVVTES
jgi:hypothetical protein